MSQTQEDGLRVDHRGPALWLVLDRPHRRNALTLNLVATLIDRLSNLPEGTRAVVLTGSPPAFCSGGDRDDLGALADKKPTEISDAVYDRFQGLVGAIAAAPVPVIAGINGLAIGGGFDLALACDLRVATTEAEFASAWITVGLVPGMGGAHMLTRIVGATRAAELVLLGRRISAQAALEWGVVNAVVDPGALQAHITSLVETLSAFPPAAVRRSKEALRRTRDAGLAEEFATLGAAQGALAVSGATFGSAGDPV